MEHPKINQQITFYYSDQFEATRNFYQIILGLKLVLDQGKCLIFEVSTTGYIGFCDKSEISPNDHMIFTLVTDDVDEWYKYLINKKVNIDRPPVYNADYNIYHLFFRDPNSYWIEIQKFYDPLWPEV